MLARGSTTRVRPDVCHERASALRDAEGVVASVSTRIGREAQMEGKQCGSILVVVAVREKICYRWGQGGV